MTPYSSPPQLTSHRAVLRVSSTCLFICLLIYCQYCILDLDSPYPLIRGSLLPLLLASVPNTCYFFFPISGLPFRCFIYPLILSSFHVKDLSSQGLTTQGPSHHIPNSGPISHCSRSHSISPFALTFFHFSVYLLFICTQS